MNASERKLFALADTIQRDNPGMDREDAICDAEKALRGAHPRPLTMRDVAQDNVRRLLARADELQRADATLDREDAICQAGGETGRVVLHAVKPAKPAPARPTLRYSAAERLRLARVRQLCDAYRARGLSVSAAVDRAWRETGGGR